MRFIFPGVRLLNKTAALILPSTPASALFYVHADACFYHYHHLYHKQLNEKKFSGNLFCPFWRQRKMKGRWKENFRSGRPLQKQEIYAILNLQHRPSVLCCSVISQLFQSLDGETIRVRVLRPDLPYSTQPYILPSESDHSPRYSAPERNNTPKIR